MNVSYVRGQDKNQLLIENTLGETDSFEYRMFENCNIPGFLNLKTSYKDGKTYLAYNISSLQDVEKYYQNKEIGYETLDVFLHDILLAYDNAYTHMLSGEKIVLDPKYMYFDVESKHLFLIYYPLYNQTLDESFMSFAEYLLERVDHTDDKAVVLAYKFYKLVKDCNFTISSLRHGLFDKEVCASKEDNIIEPSQQDCLLNDENNDVYAETAINDDEIYLPKSKGGIFKNLFKKKGSAKESIAPSFGSNLDSIGDSLSDSFCDSRLSDISGNISDCVAEESHGFDYAPDKDESYGKTVFIPQDSPNLYHTLTYLFKNKSQIYELRHFPITIGKLKNEADLVLDDKSISRIHAKITEEKGCLYLEDCNSTNGTYLNGMPLDANDHIMLEHGDEIKLGNFMLVFD